MNIRPATPADALSIGTVRCTAWRHAYEGLVPREILGHLDPREDVPRFLPVLVDPDGIFLVAEEEGEVTGFLFGGANRDLEPSPYEGEIYALYVLPPRQRRGTGTALLDRFAQAWVSRGRWSALAWVLEKNPYEDFFPRSGARPLDRREILLEGTPLSVRGYGFQDLRGRGEGGR
ncbi:GCN5-related N-acetyltransferase [Aminomonas paucivorans DSM 12260]|uniref:GCN5-related N-acetyltransferase n=1 Tax=Aminomonas paucivorans DSM 12260 TaxID=584708 RepID=E3CZI5_9BACT|nr:GNAT family N-acetyltransferase [Aminomonas paucivorans]EFQ22877.1 GCN5-related N-acetyltransferase [Aminomonas paucivorans DSM 12260]